MFTKFQSNIAKILLLTTVVTFVFGAALVAQPRETKAVGNIIPGLFTGAYGAAQSVLSVPTVPQFNWYDFLKDVFTQVSLGIAHAIAMNFLSKFVTKLTEKYKIRNFLYYDQVLTNYYLMNFIRDKISDPDLRQIYVLLESAYITGQPTGTANAPNPTKALIPRIKRAITDLYIKQTGVNPEVVANPPANMSNQDYLSQAQSFFFNAPGFTESSLRGQFGEFQSASTTAAQLEVLVGNSLKAGRFIGGTCQITEGAYIPDSTGQTATEVKIASPQECATHGGTWQTSALDQARSFIDNPTGFVDKWLLSGIGEIAGANFRPDNFWFVIGNHLGSFIWNNLFLDKPQGVLNEDPRGYTPGTYTTANNGMTGIDLDGDGNEDGYDIDRDGTVDTCIYGGTAPNCTGSASVGPGSNPGGGTSGPTPCSGVPTPIQYMDELNAAISQVIANNPNGIADAMNTEANARIFFDEVEIILQGMGLNASNDVLNGNNNPNHGDLIAIWSNGDPLAERYDVVQSVGAGNTPMRNAVQTLYVNSVDIATCIP